MALGKLAAGLAIGYVFGTRAGRDKYEQIAATARRLSAHPTAVQAQEKAKALISSGTDTVTAKIETAATEQPAATPATTARKRAPRTNGTTVTSD